VSDSVKNTTDADESSGQRAQSPYASADIEQNLMPPTTTDLLIPNFVSPMIGKAVRSLARRFGTGGSAIPGKVVDTIDPQFMTRVLAQLPLGVVLVSGTNGKTTTTRIITSILRELGLRVFTNPTGSNFVRGVVSALIEQVDLRGKLDADIAVLELDEAYAVHFVRKMRPRYALLLNVMRDQLDRFGEIDTTAKMLSSVAMATTGTLVLNREDKRIADLAQYKLPGTRVKYFGLDASLRHYFPTDDEMYEAEMRAAESSSVSNAAATTVSSAAASVATNAPTPSSDASTGADESCDTKLSQHSIDKIASEISSGLPSYISDVVLDSFDSHHAEFVICGEEKLGADLKLEGVYNLFNAAGALAVVRSVVADAQRPIPRPNGRTLSPILPALEVEEYDKVIVDALSEVTPAFGRGETIDYHGMPVELVLVKNPAGFRLALSSFDPAGTDTMIAINDEYADGRDMSWLWDVDYTSLKATGVAMMSGVRCWDMALRLGYDGAEVRAVEPNLSKAVETFLGASSTPKRIYCTYTAMLALRSHIAKLTDIADSGLK
jgi:UDP-N-acetylmuramyl tripeptide synthase